MSSPRYVAPGKPRHRILFEGGVETIVLPARGQWFVLAFLSIWLSGWTFGGVAAIVELFRELQLFLVVWLIGWAFGWTFAAASILWHIAGRETIRVVQRDLLIELRAGPIRRIRRYRGVEVQNLRVRPQTIMEWGNASIVPLFDRFGAVQFDHGARTVGLATGVDEAEAAMIRDWLLVRLPQ